MSFGLWYLLIHLCNFNVSTYIRIFSRALPNQHVNQDLSVSNDHDHPMQYILLRLIALRGSCEFRTFFLVLGTTLLKFGEYR